jgi:hypothetical protein
MFCLQPSVVSRVVLAVALAWASAGCVKTDDILKEPEGYLPPDEPLMFTLNKHSQIKLKNQWFDLFGRQSIVKEHLAQKSNRYRLYYHEIGQKLPKIKRPGGKSVDTLPEEVRVIVLLEPGTPAGAFYRLRGMAQDAGFRTVVSKPTNQAAAAAKTE